MRSWRCVVAALGIVLAAAAAPAQRVAVDSVNVTDSTLRHLVRLRDGSNLVGRILEVRGDSVRVQMDAGTMVVSRASITGITEFSADRFRNGEYWFENPHGTRLLLSATAIPLEQGTGYYANSWLIFHTFAVGLTDRFSLGGGAMWFPGVPLNETVMYLLPKYTIIDGPSARVAIGALAALLPFETIDDTDAWMTGILYGVGTTGSRDNNLSMGLGWGYAGGDVAERPILMIGGQSRMGRRLSVISENWFIPVDSRTEGLLSFGLRFLGEGLSVDLAYLKPLEGDWWLPWLGFSFRF
jgi:hypothetical protein